LEEEYRRWNVPLTLPKWNHSRLMAEFAEATMSHIPSDFVRDSIIAEGVTREQADRTPLRIGSGPLCGPQRRRPLRIIPCLDLRRAGIGA
jgi:hypothetical protein